MNKVGRCVMDVIVFRVSRERALDSRGQQYGGIRGPSSPTQGSIRDALASTASMQQASRPAGELAGVHLPRRHPWETL